MPTISSNLQLGLHDSVREANLLARPITNFGSPLKESASLAEQVLATTPHTQLCTIAFTCTQLCTAGSTCSD